MENAGKKCSFCRNKAFPKGKVDCSRRSKNKTNEVILFGHYLISPLRI